MKTVIYRGPDGWFQIHEHDVTFDRGVPLKVSDEVADFALAYEGHDFVEGEVDSPKTSKAAVRMAAEHGIDLAAVEATGANGGITVADVKAVIAADNPPSTGTTEEE